MSWHSVPQDSLRPPPPADPELLPTQAIHDHPEFRAMRRAHRSFGARAATLGVGGYLLYVLLSGFAPGVLNRPLAGRMTLGLALGLAQFVVLALVAWRHTVHMRGRVDPVARGLRAQLDRRRAEQPPLPGRRRYRSW
ncbi:DUF485 domain-containing protein [Streptomyces avermitilis]|uniref:DUF485 domain-containing protein n=1 Tax=Streptomyces avermitilis TaxID=33903 RepID=UPI0033A9F312